jgi:hypothetical protein
MNKLFFSSIFFLLFLISCDKMPKEDITIINNIVLGQNMSNYNKQMDSLSVPHQNFLTKLYIDDFNDLLDENNHINMYYSNIFNFSEERSIHNEHLGLLYPITLTGTENNIGLIVMLGHTGKPFLSSIAQKNANLISEKHFGQDISKNVVDKIQNLYVSKYGKPTSEYETKFNLIYVIEKNVINKYSDTTRVGKEISWNTKYMNITLFTGLDSYDCTYDTNKKYYSETIWSMGERVIAKKNLKINEIPCYTFAYIKYELNTEAIEKLKLNKTKI